MKWFSSKVRLICLIEGVGGTRYMDNVYVFRAGSFEDARSVALELGRAQEESFENAEGEQVRWRLVGLVSLDSLPDDLDRAEVYSEPVALGPDEQFGFDAEFTPEDSRPTQTV